MACLPEHEYIDPEIYNHLSETKYLYFLCTLCANCYLLEHFKSHNRYSHLQDDLIDGCLSDVLIGMHVCKTRPSQHIIAYIYKALRYRCLDINQKEIAHPMIHWNFDEIQISETTGHENVLENWEGFFSRDLTHNFVLKDELMNIWVHFSQQESQILKLRFMEGWSYQHISLLLNIPKTTLYHLIDSLQNRFMLYMAEIRGGQE